jgi:hypothetical protein
MRLLPGTVEDIMDRRQFGKLALSAGAATTGEAALALAQTSSVSPSDALKLPAELRPAFEQDYPRFSDAEYSRRRDLLAGVMEAAGVDHLLIVSALNVGNATRWVTGWPGTNQALLLFRPGEKMVMYVEYHNHVPQARLIARDVDVRWGEDKGVATVVDELGRRGGRRWRQNFRWSASTASTPGCGSTTNRRKRSRGCAWARR